MQIISNANLILCLSNAIIILLSLIGIYNNTEINRETV